MGQSIVSGGLSITAPAGLNFSEVTVAASNQTPTATLSPVNVSDLRGTGVGWSSSMTVQNLTLTRSPVANSGNTSPLIELDDDNRYDGGCGVNAPAISYIVAISAGGSVGTSTYSVTGGCSDTNQSNVTTAATGNNVGDKGVKIKFPAGNYVAGNSWTITVDVYPYTGMLVTPQAATAAVAGSDLDGVTEADEETLTGAGTVSSPKVLLTAASDKGMGSYDQDVLLQLAVHALSYAGNYTGTLTLNVS